MSDLKPKHTKINLGGKEYGMLFSLNAIDEIQDRFNIPITQIDELMADERNVFKALKGIVTILVTEAIDDSENGEPHVTEAFVGRKITAADLATTKGSIFSAFTGSMPETDPDDEEADDSEDPTKSGQ